MNRHYSLKISEISDGLSELAHRSVSLCRATSAFVCAVVIFLLPLLLCSCSKEESCTHCINYHGNSASCEK